MQQNEKNIKNIFIAGISTGILFILIGLIFIFSKPTSKPTTKQPIKNIKASYKENKKLSNSSFTTITVNIKGAIKNEGIYTLNKGQRISDLINKAGGLTKQADKDKINLAYKLKDGDTVIIPKIGEDISIYETVISQKKIENYKPHITRKKKTKENKQHKKVVKLKKQEKKYSSTNKKTNQNNYIKKTSYKKLERKVTKEETNKISINSATKQELLNIPGITPEIADNIIEFRKINGKIYTIDDLILINGIDEDLLKNIKKYIKL